MYKFTLLKSHLTTNTLLALFKILGTLTGNSFFFLCNGARFQNNYRWCKLKSSNYLKGNLRKTYILVFPETFKAAVFLKIAVKRF